MYIFLYIFQDFIQFQHKLIVWKPHRYSVLDLSSFPPIFMYFLYMHTHAIHTLYAFIRVTSSIWQSLDVCRQLINGWTETKQVKLVGVSFACVYSLSIGRACVLAYVLACVPISVYVTRVSYVRVLLSCYLEQSSGHKSQRRYRVCLDMRAVCLSQGDIKMSIKQPLFSFSIFVSSSSHS